MKKQTTESDVSKVLAAFQRTCATVAKIKDSRVRDQKVREIKAALKSDHKLYYVRTYTVHAHLRRIPVRKKVH